MSPNAAKPTNVIPFRRPQKRRLPILNRYGMTRLEVGFVTAIVVWPFGFVVGICIARGWL